MSFTAFYEDIKSVGSLAVMLLGRLEPEPYYVRGYIERECRKLVDEGWRRRHDWEKPWVKTFERNGYILKIAFIHARKGEHITGADIAFELSGRKIIFVQSKRVHRNGRIYFNRLQLQKLLELEWEICGFPYIAFPLAVIPSLPYRVTFYHLIMREGLQIEERFFHTSEVSFILSWRKSASQTEFINQGLRPDEFQEMFWKCRIGGPDIREDKKRDILYMYSLITNRLVVWLDVMLK